MRGLVCCAVLLSAVPAFGQYGPPPVGGPPPTGQQEQLKFEAEILMMYASYIYGLSQAKYTEGLSAQTMADSVRGPSPSQAGLAKYADGVAELNAAAITCGDGAGWYGLAIQRQYAGDAAWHARDYAAAAAAYTLAAQYWLKAVDILGPAVGQGERAVSAFNDATAIWMMQ